MAEENSLPLDVHAATLSRNSPVLESQQAKKKNDKDSKKSKEKRENSNTVPYFKLFSFADSKDYTLMFVGIIASAGNGLVIPIVTIIIGEAINAFGENSFRSKQVVHQVSKACVNFVYLALGGSVAGFLQVACWIVTGERQAARIRSLYLKAILRQEIGFFDKETSTGEIIGMMSGDTVLIQNAMGEKVGKFLQLITTFVSGLVIGFFMGWKLTLVMLSFIPLYVLGGALMTFVISKAASRGQTAYSLAATVVEQTIGSIRTVASFTGEKQAVAKYDDSLNKAYKSGVQEGLASGLGFGVVMLITQCTYAFVAWFGAKMILNEGYKGGDIINVMFQVLTGSVCLGQTSPCLSAFAAVRAAAFKMFEVIDRNPGIDAYNTNGRTLDDIHGDIELKDVHFSYPARPDDKIFNGFSLLIPSGSTTALVGESGSGKSTVISLIQRFYDPQAGEVLIDNINLKEFQLKWIRQKISLVSQEPVLFSCSIRDNIAYGKDGATTEEIRAAAELANASKFIDKLPQGLDTMVGEHCTQLSGGQKQRIAIARAILKDPRVLLLDEATSALDTESERIVQEALERFMINRTTVVVAHRLSTVKNADMIAVIHLGKIFEKGSHSELTMDPNGAYSQLTRLQEICRVSKSYLMNDQDRPEILMDSERHSSEQLSFPQSISRGSPRTDSSSSHSFSLPAESYALASITSKAPGDVPMHRLANLNKPEIPVLLLGSLVAVANGVILPVIGLLLANMIKTFFEPPDQLRKDSRFWSLVFLAIAVMCLTINSLRSYLFAVAGCKLIKRVRSMCFKKVVYMEVSWFDEPAHSSGAISARLSADAASLRSFVGDALGLLVQNLTTIVFALVIAFEANWRMALITLGLLPLFGVNGYVHVKSIKGFSADTKKMYEEASQVASDAVGNIRTVASFCAEEKVMELHRKKCEGPKAAGIKEGLICGTGFGLASMFFSFVYGTALYAGARLVEAGDATYTQVFQVFYALTMATLGVSQSISLIPDVSKTKIAATSLFAILDQPSKIHSSDDSGEKIENVRGEIQFRHVSFKYPTRPDVQIFKDLCLAIHCGKTVALVGESGCGKSTIISLLQRFYDPDSGHITLDGIEIQKLQVKWLRQQMGLVSQEPVLFNDTIRANIAYGKEENATEAEILAAGELANAHKFICSLQQGYDTVVGERGIQLSGGQKQRVAIARAIIKDPKILLLDEATSALDAESERVVQDALDRVVVNRTAVVVAHRLSTIKNADLIAVVKNGIIAEKGKHETLMNIKDGIYASLVAFQTSASSS